MRQAMKRTKYIEEEHEVLDITDEEHLDGLLLAFNLSHKGSGEDTHEDIEYPYIVLSPDEIYNNLMKKVEAVNEFLQLPITTVRLLLTHFKWDDQKLLEIFFNGDTSDLFIKSNILDTHLKQAVDDKSQECLICFCMEDDKTGKFHSMDCKHYLCQGCWREYLINQIDQEGNSYSILCPGTNCKQCVDDETVIRFTDSRIHEKLKYFMSSSYVNSHSLMKWCPRNGCQNAFQVMWVSWREVTCKCGNSVCYKCMGIWHAPVECEVISRWGNECKSETEFASWITLNTKNCPQCGTSIQKSGGCNIIRCTLPSCRCSFCWNCGEAFKSHSIFSCNKYIPSLKPSQISINVERFNHYHKLYLIHQRSLEMEETLPNLVAKEHMKRYTERIISPTDLKLFETVVSVLIKCRRTIIHTAIFGYYAKECSQKTIFEDNQNNLIQAVEELSGYLQLIWIVDETNFIKMNQNLINKSRYCHDRAQVLINHVYEGYKKKWWGVDLAG